MRSRSVIVVEIQTKGSTERGLAEDDQVIEAFTPNGSDDALDVGSLPRRPRSGQHFPDSHGFGLLHEVSTENPISIAQQIARRGIPGKCLHQLSGGPLGGRMGRHVEVEDAAPIMGKHQKHIQDLKADRGDGEEVDRHQRLDVALEEYAPRLRWWLPATHHVFCRHWSRQFRCPA